MDSSLVIVELARVALGSRIATYYLKTDPKSVKLRRAIRGLYPATD